MAKQRPDIGQPLERHHAGNDHRPGQGAAIQLGASSPACFFVADIKESKTVGRNPYVFERPPREGGEEGLMTDSRETNTREPKTEIDTAGWLFVGAAAVITAITVMVVMHGAKIITLTGDPAVPSG